MKVSVLNFCFAFLLSSLTSSVFKASAEDSSSDQKEGPQWKVVKAQKPAKSSELPVELISQVKDSYRDKKIEKKFMTIEMFLFDDHQVISPPVKIITPLGGGQINLGSLLPEGQAKFNFRIYLIGPSGEKVLPDQVYFVPLLPHEENDVEVHCGSYFNITNTFNQKIMSETGMETYITEGLYAPLLSGSFLFVKQTETELLLGNLNLMDSRYSDKTCPLGKRPKK